MCVLVVLPLIFAERVEGWGVVQLVLNLFLHNADKVLRTAEMSTLAIIHQGEKAASTA